MHRWSLLGSLMRNVNQGVLCNLCMWGRFWYVLVMWGRFSRWIKVLLHPAALSNFLEISSRTWKDLSAWSNILSANVDQTGDFAPIFIDFFFPTAVSPIRINRSRFFCIIKWRRSLRKAVQSQTLWKTWSSTISQQPPGWYKNHYNQNPYNRNPYNRNPYTS